MIEEYHSVIVVNSWLSLKEKRQKILLGFIPPKIGDYLIINKSKRAISVIYSGHQTIHVLLSGIVKYTYVHLI